jgi:transposase InsO family protein
VESIAGLADRSRAPHHQAFAVSAEVEQELLRLKQQWSLWGAPKLHFKLREQLSEERCPSESTVSNILKRHGLTKPKRRRRVIATAAPQPYGQAPNDVWCTDFKGWFHLVFTHATATMAVTLAAQGKPIPAADVQLARLAALAPVLNLSAIARGAGMPVQTLATKLQRGIAFTAEEGAKIGNVLAAHGLAG